MNKQWILISQSRVQEGHKEDRVANNGPFNRLFLSLKFYLSIKAIKYANYKNIKRLKAIKYNHWEETKKEKKDH